MGQKRAQRAFKEFMEGELSSMLRGGFSNFDSQLGQEYESLASEMRKIHAAATGKGSRAQLLHHLMAHGCDQICFVAASKGGIICAARALGCKAICASLRFLLSNIWRAHFARLERGPLEHFAIDQDQLGFAQSNSAF